MYKLIVARPKKEIFRKNFETITDAYNYYVKYFATLKEKIYYWGCAKKSLKKINNEKVMLNLFDNVFIWACIKKER